MRLTGSNPPPMPATLRQHFEQELGSLQQDVLRMGAYVVEMLGDAITALSQRDPNLAAQVVEMDDVADEMDLQIEHACLRLLALQQPLSKDLRIISTALKIITDLERIGDFSVDIAKTARRVAREPYVRPAAELPQMAECVKSLVHEALQAYVTHDLQRVRRAIEMDDRVDDFYDKIFTELLCRAEREPESLRQVVWLTHVIHFLERIADHAVNVAERVHYMETGELKQLAASHRSDNSG